MVAKIVWSPLICGKSWAQLIVVWRSRAQVASVKHQGFWVRADDAIKAVHNGGGNGDTTTENTIKRIQSTDDDIFLFREFAKEKERVESRAGFMALKESQRLERELTGYVDWICRAGSVDKYR